MKSDNRKFGQMLFKLNSKVNRRSTYLHNMSLKYHNGLFSHNVVLSNIKNEPCLQTPRSYVHVDLKPKDSILGSLSRSYRRGEDTSLCLPLRTTLVKFYDKPSPKVSRHSSYFSKRGNYISRPKYRLDEDIGIDIGLEKH